jgi:hypothetical protein
MPPPEILAGGGSLGVSVLRTVERLSNRKLAGLSRVYETISSRSSKLLPSFPAGDGPGVAPSTTPSMHSPLTSSSRLTG